MIYYIRMLLKYLSLGWICVVENNTRLLSKKILLQCDINLQINIIKEKWWINWKCDPWNDVTVVYARVVMPVISPEININAFDLLETVEWLKCVCRSCDRWLCHVLFHLWPLDWETALLGGLLRHEGVSGYECDVIYLCYHIYETPSCNTLFLLLKWGFGIGSEILKELSQVRLNFLHLSGSRGNCS